MGANMYNEVFTGYIILPKRKKNVSFQDIDCAVQSGTLHKTKTKANLDVGNGERVEKITITVKLGKS